MWFQLIIENVKIRWKKCVDGIYTAEGLENKTALWSKYHFIVRQEALRLHKRLPANVELDDLIQAGSMGFLSAIDSFDPKKGGP